MNEDQLVTLCLIRSGLCQLRPIARRRGCSLATIYRAVNELKRRGLVDWAAEAHGTLHLTRAGALFVHHYALITERGRAAVGKARRV